MSAIAYKHYRILVSKVRGGTYLTINTIAMFEFEQNDNLNILVGSTATARSNYDAINNPPSNVLDGNTSTYWASQLLSGSTQEWISFELPTAKVVRKFIITSQSYTAEAAKDYKIQASQDGIEWITIYKEIENTVEPINRVIFLGHITGVSKNSTGSPNDRVLVSDWGTGELIESIAPNADGAFYCYPQTDIQLMVTHIGPSGYQPKSDGPITPYE